MFILSIHCYSLLIIFISFIFLLEYVGLLFLLACWFFIFLSFFGESYTEQFYSYITILLMISITIFHHDFIFWVNIFLILLSFVLFFFIFLLFFIISCLLISKSEDAFIRRLLMNQIHVKHGLVWIYKNLYLLYVMLWSTILIILFFIFILKFG